MTPEARRWLGLMVEEVVDAPLLEKFALFLEAHRLQESLDPDDEEEADLAFREACARRAEESRRRFEEGSCVPSS